MKLLVSVRSAEEARAALAGGADIIDAKEPRNGALGAVAPGDLRAIVEVAGDARPVSAALGDASEPLVLERDVAAFAGTGVVFVKIGFAGITDGARVESLACTAAGVVRPARLVLVGYADADRAGSIPPHDLIAIAGRTGAYGILLDTFDKHGPALRELISDRALREFVEAGHHAGLIVAVAGKVAIDDISRIDEAGADIVGVRGAACEGGRDGYVTAARVQKLSAATTACASPAGSARVK